MTEQQLTSENTSVSFEEGRKEGNVLFNDALFTVICHRTFGEEPLRQ